MPATVSVPGVPDTLATMDPRRLDLDFAQVRRAFDRAAATYARAALVPGEVERRMAEKLDYLKLDPVRVLDAGSGTGSARPLLRARYPRAELVAVDLSLSMLGRSRAPRGLRERLRVLGGAAAHWICADFSRLPLRGGSFGVVWSSLALAWAGDPLATLSEFHRVLAPGGALMFSTYGPDTLKELKAAFAAVDSAEHVHPFTDMHDLGDMLVASGFDAPVMEMDKIKVTYADVGALMRDLKSSGQTCASAGRRRGLMTPREWRRMQEQYDKARLAGRLPVTVEIVYGHAWRGQRAVSGDGRQVVRFERGR
jgi:malonyl-CoA O-methyltransferase